MTVNRMGFCTSFLLTLVTLVSFGVVVPPVTGPFCPGTCIEYPYLDILSRFPREYIWMYTSVLLCIFYVILMVCLHYYASSEKKVFSLAGLSFALLAAVVLVCNYFVQVSVVQQSLINGETNGIALLTQYNPHGIFIALEELGYLLMSISFFFIALVFFKRGRLANAIGLIFMVSFWLTMVSLIYIFMQFGVHREYIFECVVIVINWLVLIINGIMLSILFRRTMKKSTD